MLLMSKRRIRVPSLESRRRSEAGECRFGSGGRKRLIRVSRPKGRDARPGLPNAGARMTASRLTQGERHGKEQKACRDVKYHQA